MKKLNLILSGLLLIMILSIGIGTAMAYFTDTTAAEGGRTVSVEYHATPTEEIENNLKAITLTADPGSLPVYVRARAYSSYEVTYTRTDDNWEQVVDNGVTWWRYRFPIQDGESTTQLIAEIEFLAGEEGDTANVIVITEYTPVQYDEDGNALPADFNIPVEGGES